MAYAMWALAASFYLYQFILRVSSSVLVPDLMQAFHLDASGVGALSSLALYTYSSLQIPAGLLADVLGVRRILLGSALLCVLGNVLFSRAEVLFWAQIGRFLIGAGSAAAFLSVSKVVMAWFPSHRHSFFFGLTMTAGTLGALNGGVPLAWWVSQVGWREALTAVSGLGVLVFCAIAFFLKESKHSRRGHLDRSGSSEKSSGLLLRFFQNPTSWIYALCAFGCYLPVNVISDLWGPTFLVQAYGVSLSKASQSTSLLYIGLCVGSLFLTALSDRLQRKRLLIQVSLFFLSFSSFLLIVGAGQEWMGFVKIQILLGLIGFWGGASMVCFAGLLELQNPLIGGTVVGFINTVVMLFGALAQQATGWLLDYHRWVVSPGFDLGAVQTYSLEDYRFALALMPGLTLFSSMIAWMIPKKNR